MANRGTPYDKHHFDWWDGEPRFSRYQRNRFAIEEGLHEVYADYPYESPLDGCGCVYFDGEYCGFCLLPEHTESEKQLAARKARKKRRAKGEERPDTPRWSRWRRNSADYSLSACSGEPHLWENQYRWVAQPASPYSRRFSEPCMKKTRFLVCGTCGEEAEMRSGYRMHVTRPMTEAERARYDAEIEAERAKAEKYDRYWAAREHRNKQAPPKRTERKRPDPTD